MANRKFICLENKYRQWHQRSILVLDYKKFIKRNILTKIVTTKNDSIN